MTVAARERGFETFGNILGERMRSSVPLSVRRPWGVNGGANGIIGAA